MHNSKAVKFWGGPGCGKTSAEMTLYQDFIENGYKPEDITAITFRKSSANDLISQVSNLIKVEKDELKSHVGTIHSICNRLSGHNTLIESGDIATFMKKHNYNTDIKAVHGVPPSEDIEDVSTDDTVKSGTLLDLYTWMRNTQTPLDKLYLYPGFEKIGLPYESLQQFIVDYEQYKSSIQKIDFSDMLQVVLDEKIPIDTPILMVDEFQDLTAQMYKIFEMWIPQCEHVVIAGDPLQSIYGFWGGSPEYYNRFKATEQVLGESFRLPSQIWTFAKTVLAYEGMKAPTLKTKTGYKLPIKEMKFDDKFPTHLSELHLIRCNYQAGGVAMQLAESGKVFGGLYGWSTDELNIANTIQTFRQGKQLSLEQMQTLAEYYPCKVFGVSGNKEDVISKLNKSYNPNSSSLRTGEGFIKPIMIDALMSDDPTILMNRSNKLLTAKIKGVIEHNTNINFTKKGNDGKLPVHKYTRNILTIHGSKGLEAEAVFLHTAITPEIQKNIVIPGEESAAEARVWYVGATRAKDVLYLVKDKGRNYSLPEATTC